MSAEMQWTGISEMQARLEDYRRRCRLALHLIAEYYAPVVEAAAKADATWTDRTGNARQGLTGFVKDLSETSVAIYLAHRMDYGLYLELAHQARYAIILPTLEQHYQPVMDMVRKVFS